MQARDNDMPAYRDVSLSVEQRVDDLVRRMTLEEKISQMRNAAPAIERLDVPEYDWWNECLHGVARAGIATVFPQAIGLASTWNTELISRVATAISDEARAKHHEFVRNGNRARYTGLTFWSPNINIFRDPRWGRGQETYGECPYLTARMGVVFVQGLQGDDPRYLKLVGTPKHFAVHSGPEHDRHHFDARVSQRDLRQTYLPAFRACVQEGKAVSVMGAYNRTEGEPCCASTTLLQQILRDEWGFDGYVVSDCGAIWDIFRHHRVAETPEQAAAMAVRAGCDLECGSVYENLGEAVRQGLIAEQEIDQAVRRLFSARIRLGMFDPPEVVPYAQIPYEVNDSEAHRALALECARQSLVLLKNDKGFLPLRPGAVRSIAVIGPNADDVEVLLGNYNGTPSRAVTPFEGIRNRAGPGIPVFFARGSGIITGSVEETLAAAEVVRRCDLVVACVGISQLLEGEEGQEMSEGISQGDRSDIDLPQAQDKLLRAISALGKPMVVVLINGSALSINWLNEQAQAILEAWYPGEEGGTAIAEAIFGDYSPGGRLPVTFYRSVDDLPSFTDYAMEGRTYRYFRGDPLFPFGFGLSYTRFRYSGLRVTPDRLVGSESIQVSVKVSNAGQCAGDEVIQAYVADLEASVPVPIRQLVGFRRIHLEPVETKMVTFAIQPEQLSLITEDGKRMVEAGKFQIAVGGCQPGCEERVQGVTEVLRAFVDVPHDITITSL